MAHSLCPWLEKRSPRLIRWGASLCSFISRVNAAVFSALSRSTTQKISCAEMTSHVRQSAAQLYPEAQFALC
jgi:hypothetical protein